MEAIHIMRRMNYQVRKRKFHMIFIDLEKMRQSTKESTLVDNDKDETSHETP